MSVVTIVGAGMMGSAMSFPLRDNGHEVRLVGTHLDREIIQSIKAEGLHPTLKRKLPEGIDCFQIEHLEQAISGADTVVGGVSSFGVEWFAANVLPVIPEGIPLLSVTKGMQNESDGSLISYPRLYCQLLPRASEMCLNAVGGPCTSYELADRDQTEICFCGKDIRKLRQLKNIFETTYYHISLSEDVEGVECAVAMKNAYALGVTLAVGLSERRNGIGGRLNYNSQAALFAQGLKEMRNLLKLVGGRDENILWGAGDLYVTVFGGRTRLIGTLLGRGMSFKDAMSELSGITLESVVIAGRTADAVRTLIKRGRASEADYPLLLHIDDIIRHDAEVDIPWSKFETEIVL
ncbi:MAG: glycerol-3-phosphate dehydrogenase [Eubacteriales bacterium]|nr:glycerol-3-phosphate dehydrogenase [Eubacteriales bacterium]